MNLSIGSSILKGNRRTKSRENRELETGKEAGEESVGKWYKHDLSGAGNYAKKSESEEKRRVAGEQGTGSGKPGTRNGNECGNRENRVREAVNGVRKMEEQCEGRG